MSVTRTRSVLYSARPVPRQLFGGAERSEQAHA